MWTAGWIPVFLLFILNDYYHLALLFEDQHLSYEWITQRRMQPIYLSSVLTFVCNLQLYITFLFGTVLLTIFVNIQIDAHYSH